MSPSVNGKPRNLMLVVVLLVACTPFLSAQSRTSARTRKLLNLIEISHGKGWGPAFRYGDQHIGELIIALRDPDPEVRRKAQRVIRYLGDPDGMQALFSSYESAHEKGQTTMFMGPIPVPLSEWDFANLEKGVLCDQCKLQGPFVDYFYALALDRSPRAREMLVRIMSKAPYPLLYGEQPYTGTLPGKNLSREILDHAFYLDSQERKVTSVQKLAATQDGKKSIYEVYVNHGVLAEKWFHVVLVKQTTGWRVLSISFAGES